VVSSGPRTIKVRCVCGSEQDLTSRYDLRYAYSCGCVKPPQDAEGPRRARIEQRVRRTDLSQYLLDIVRKRQAVRDGKLECSLTPKDFQIPTLCPERNVPLRLGNGGQKTANSPTVVRLDLSLGYVPGNIRIISWAAAQDLAQRQRAEKKAAALAIVEVAQRAEQEAQEVAQRAEQEAQEVAQRAEQTTRNIERRERWIKRTEQWIKELERPVYDKRVSTLPCSVRLDRALQQLGVETIMDLLALGPKCFHEQRNVGRTSVKELECHMRDLGVMWPNPATIWLLNEG